MVPPPVDGKRNCVTKPDLISGKSGVAGGFGVSTGFTLPAVVGTFVPEIMLTQLKPATVTISGFAGLSATANRLSQFTPPMKVEYFRSAVPAPSSLNRATNPSSDPFHVVSSAPGVTGMSRPLADDVV